MRNIYHILILFSLLFVVQSSAFAGGQNPFDKEAITIYPNPVVYEANISLDKDLNLYENELSIYFFNVVGEMIHEIESIQSHDFTLNKELFRRSGIYLFQLKMNGEVLKTGKINIH